MSNSQEPIRLRRPNPPTLGCCLVLVGLVCLAAVLKSAFPRVPFVGIAFWLCLMGFSFGLEDRLIGNRDGAKAGVMMGLVTMSGIVVWFKWGQEGLFALFAGLVVVGLPVQRLADRRRMREDEAERAAPPVFPDRKQEKRRVFLRLLPRILAAAMIREKGEFTATEHAALVEILTHDLGREAPDPKRIHSLDKAGQFALSDLNELLWLFHRNCSYESHLVLVGMLLQLCHSARPPNRTGTALARDIARNIGVSDADWFRLETEAAAVVAAEDEARTEERRRLEEEEYERLETEQAHAAVASRHSKEEWWLIGLWLGCLFLALVVGQDTSRVDVGVFDLFLVVMLMAGPPLFFVYHRLFRPMRHARLDRRLARERRQAREEAAHALAARLLTAFARLDGRFAREAWAATLDFFQDEPGDDAARLDRIKTLVKRALDDPQDLDRILRAFARDAPDSSRRALADLALRLASAQGPASPAKARLARDVAAALDIRSDRPAS